MKIPPLEPVSSSAIKALGYDPEVRRVFVQFTDGAIHSFANVSEGGYRAFREASSVGNYYRKQFAGTASMRHGSK